MMQAASTSFESLAKSDDQKFMQSSAEYLGLLKVCKNNDKNHKQIRKILEEENQNKKIDARGRRSNVILGYPRGSPSTYLYFNGTHALR